MNGSWRLRVWIQVLPFQSQILTLWSGLVRPPFRISLQLWYQAQFFNQVIRLLLVLEIPLDFRIESDFLFRHPVHPWFKLWTCFWIWWIFGRNLFYPNFMINLILKLGPLFTTSHLPLSYFSIGPDYQIWASLPKYFYGEVPISWLASTVELGPPYLKICMEFYG